MQPLDAVYLQILKNLCTDLSEPVPLDGVDPSALYRLAEKHCSLPFLLPYFEQQPQFSALKQQTKQMLLSYYQLEHFTRLTFSLLLAEKIPCFLLKGISLAANYPIPEYRKLGDLDLYIPEKDAFSRACRILNAHGYTEEPEESDGPTITVNGKEIQGEGSSVTVGGVTVELSDEKQQRLAEHNVAEQDVTLGVRPDHLMLCADGIKGTVDVSEMMGSSVHLHVAAEGKDVIVIVPTNGAAAHFPMGSEVNMIFGGNVAHVFDKETGKNLEW